MFKKKIIAILLAILLLTGCSNNRNRTTQFHEENFNTSSNNVVQHFEPLSDDEQLAYHEVGNRTMFYAIKNKNPSDRRFITEWEDVKWGRLQFANNRRDCFFLENNSMYEKDRYVYPSYYLNGKTGTIEYIKNVSQPVNITTDGQFIIYLLNSYNGGQTGIFVIYSISERKDIHEFGWTVEKNEYGDGGFSFRRTPNGKIRILHTVDGGGVAALAEINPKNKQFIIDWDITDKPDILPRDLDDPEFLDDWTYQWLNPEINLEF